MVRAIAFDLDHTLYDRYATLTEISKEIRKAFRVGENVTDEEIAEQWCRCDKRFVYFEDDVMFGEFARCGVFAKPYPPADELNRFRIECFMTCTIPYTYTNSVLEELKKDGYRLALITNGSIRLQSAKINNLGITDYFDRIYIGEQYKQKPSAAMFLKCADDLGLSPQEILYVGDNPINDVEASRLAGMTPVWVKTCGEWAFPALEKPEYSIDSINELPSLVRSINKH